MKSLASLHAAMNVSDLRCGVLKLHSRLENCFRPTFVVLWKIMNKFSKIFFKTYNLVIRPFENYYKRADLSYCELNATSFFWQAETKSSTLSNYCCVRNSCGSHTLWVTFPCFILSPGIQIELDAGVCASGSPPQ